MGCVLSSERGADDFGADSRTMLARPKPRVLGVIPARYNSRRFAGKPLALLAGKPLVMHVYRNACKAKCLDACVVATDDDRIAKAVRDNGGEVIMTDAACETSPERCLEVVRKLRRRRAVGADGKKTTTWTAAAGEFNVVVCIDADEPFVQPHHIETVADLVVNSDAAVGTLVRPAIDEEDVTSSATVKVVTDDRDYALLFSREPVPKRVTSSSVGGVARSSAYDPEVAYKVRVGIQACGTDFLEKYASLLGRERSEPGCVADKENESPPRTKKNGEVVPAAKPPESIADEPEQNRVVFAGYKIKVDVVESTFVPGVKTPEDLKHLNAGLAAGLVNDLQLTILAA